MNPKNNIMEPKAIQAMAIETRKESRLYSKTTDNGEVVEALVSRLAAELADLPKKIDLKDCDMVESVAVTYCDACAKAGVIPSKIGLCRAMGISRQAVDSFLHRHSDEPSAELLRMIFDSFAEMLNSAALASAVHPIVSIFLSKAIYNYRDTVSIEAEPTFDPLGTRQTAAEIMAKYKDLEAAELMLPD